MVTRSSGLLGIEYSYPAPVYVRVFQTQKGAQAAHRKDIRPE